MVRFTVQNLGEHTIDQMVVRGPFAHIVMEMTEMFLASYTGSPDEDLDYHFAEYIIKTSYGQGQILDYQPRPAGPPEEIH